MPISNIITSSLNMIFIAESRNLAIRSSQVSSRIFVPPQSSHHIGIESLIPPPIRIGSLNNLHEH